MSLDLPEPERWCDLPAGGETAEGAIGAALRRVKEATEPSDVAVARLARRTNPPALATSRRNQLIWRLVVAAVLIMATGGVVGAALNRWRRAQAAASADAGESAGAVTRSKEARHHRRSGHWSSAVQPAPAVVLPAVDPIDPRVPPPPAPAAAAEAPSASATANVNVNVNTSADASTNANASASASVRRAPARLAGTHAATDGADLVAAAFRELRSSGNAAAALRALDQYERHFPAGALRDEARIARVEALLTLNRRQEALRLLEGFDASGGTLTRDARATRGELLAENGRCAQALRDFDAVVAVRDGDGPGGRALYGRASCRLSGGDRQAARQDLLRYLSLHPNDPLSANARRVLSSLP